MNAPDHPGTAQARASHEYSRGGFMLGLGAYGLWVLLNKDTERLFSGAPPATV